MLYHLATLDHTPPTKFTPLNTHGRALWIYLLTRGFTLGYHQHVLRVADITLAKHLGRAQAAALSDPTIRADVLANANSITPADGLLMAQRRGTAHMPFWARLAIGEMRRNGVGVTEVADLFQCSRETVRKVLSRPSQAFHAFTGLRRLNSAQILPVGRWTSVGS